MPEGADLKPGERVAVRGKRLTSSGGIQTFQTKKVVKELGACNGEPAVSAARLRPSEHKKQVVHMQSNGQTIGATFDEVAEQVVSIIASVKHMPRERISLDSPFHELGLDSRSRCRERRQERARTAASGLFGHAHDQRARPCWRGFLPPLGQCQTLRPL
jgi:hypothetical protein